MKKILALLLLSTYLFAGFDNMTPQLWGWIGVLVVIACVKLYILYWVISKVIKFFKNFNKENTKCE